MNPSLLDHAIPGALHFEDSPVGPRAIISSALCEAEVYFRGAHVTRFAPKQARELLFLSKKSVFAKDVTVHGGVPIVFPWFGPRNDGDAGPMHGFARTAMWSLTEARRAADDTIELGLRLEPSDASRALGYDAFAVQMNIRAGRHLEMELVVSNPGSRALVFEAAFHTYLAVADVEKIRIEGLSGTRYIDKADGQREKRTTAERVCIVGEVNQVHLDTTARCIVHETGRASVEVAKEGSRTTVIWNPGEKVARHVSDLVDGAWRNFVCIETANAGDNRVTLAPGESHRMSAQLSVL